MNRMRSFLIVFLVFFLMGGITAYAGQFGSPEPIAKDGRLSLGIGYFYFTEEWAPTDWRNGFKVEGEQKYLQGSGRFMGGVEVYNRIGLSNLKIKDNFITESFLYDLNPDFQGKGAFATFGVKGFLNCNSWLGVGHFFQMNFSVFNDSVERTINTSYGNSFGVIQKTIASSADINVGTALQAKIFGVILYAGPVVYWSRAYVNYRVWITETGRALVANSIDYTEKENFGGFAGIRLPLIGGLSVGVEGQMKNGFSAGGLLVYSF